MFGISERRELHIISERFLSTASAKSNALAQSLYGLCPQVFHGRETIEKLASNLECALLAVTVWSIKNSATKHGKYVNYFISLINEKRPILWSDSSHNYFQQIAVQFYLNEANSLCSVAVICSLHSLRSSFFSEAGHTQNETIFINQLGECFNDKINTPEYVQMSKQIVRFLQEEMVIELTYPFVKWEDMYLRP
jgi:hypothetical protein